MKRSLAAFIVFFVALQICKTSFSGKSMHDANQNQPRTSKDKKLFLCEEGDHFLAKQCDVSQSQVTQF